VRLNLGEGGRYRLASGPGRWLDGHEIQVHPGLTTKHYLGIGGTGGVSLVVRDLEGEYVSKVKASVRSVGGDHVHSVKHRLQDSLADESLYTTGLPEGRYLLEYGKRGYQKAREEIVVTAGRVRHTDAVLELIPMPDKKDGSGSKSVLRALGYLDDKKGKGNKGGKGGKAHDGKQGG